MRRVRPDVPGGDPGSLQEPARARELEDADAHAEGQNPLCGDEVSIYVAFAADGETIEEVKFSGRGCAISQAATSMLTEMVRGPEGVARWRRCRRRSCSRRSGSRSAPVRLKCAILGLGTLKVALHKAKGTPLPEEWAGFANELELK